MVKPLEIFAVVWVAMFATSFWESYVEGRNAFDKGKFGWKIEFGKFYLTGYHFFLFIVMFPLLLSLPLVIYGWDKRLFGTLLSAYLTGTIVEDFGWFVVNPVVKISEFGPKFVDYYPWFKLGKVAIPVGYVLSVLGAFASWWVLWR